MPKESKMLTWDDVEQEVAKVEKFFGKLPDELHAEAAERFIAEIVTWAGRDHYQAIGILMEAMLSHREISLQVMAEEDKAKVRPGRKPKVDATKRRA